MTVVHDWPIRGRRQQPVEEYGRAYARDPVEWLARKRRLRANQRVMRRKLAKTDHQVAASRKRRGWLA